MWHGWVLPVPFLSHFIPCTRAGTSHLPTSCARTHTLSPSLFLFPSYPQDGTQVQPHCMWSASFRLLTWPASHPCSGGTSLPLPGNRQECMERQELSSSQEEGRQAAHPIPDRLRQFNKNSMHWVHAHTCSLPAASSKHGWRWRRRGRGALLQKGTLCCTFWPRRRRQAAAPGLGMPAFGETLGRGRRLENLCSASLTPSLYTDFGTFLLSTKVALPSVLVDM